ncbi:MAB_1171c family putative transporter [Streptomyces mirabilis]|uniref:MAB_1171c family putative transporter n=1 Tax=Streptomyces mirabilis TaxID=68239 RepID=UPI0036A6062D
MAGAIYYLVALVLWGALALKVPALRRDWNDPIIRAMCAVVLFAGASWALAAPSSIAAINHTTGTPNIAAPVVYAVSTAYSTACLTLMACWAYPDSDRARRISRMWMLICIFVCVALFVLFFLGNAPLERRRDLAVYYANTPFISVMIILYLVTDTIAAAITSMLCVVWATRSRISGWSRTGLLVLVTGFTLNAAFGVVTLTAVIGTRMGHEMTFLGATMAPRLVALGAILVSVGYILPVAGTRIDSTLAYIRLAPLSRHLHDNTKYTMHLSRWSSAQMRLTSRQTVIQDGIIRIARYLDPAVQHSAEQSALASGATRRDAQAIGDAAMLVIAAIRRTQPHQPAQLVTSLDHLVRVSRAIHTPIVESVRDRALESQRA